MGGIRVPPTLLERYKMKVLIYTTYKCSFCIKAKKFLQKYDIEYTEKEIDKLSNINMESFRKDCPGAKTVPQILIDGNLISGGYLGLIESNIVEQWNARQQ